MEESGDNSLVGKELEIRWRYWRATVEGERGKRRAVDIWAEGTVRQVANDASDKDSPRFKVPAKFKGTNAVGVACSANLNSRWYVFRPPDQH